MVVNDYTDKMTCRGYAERESDSGRGGFTLGQAPQTWALPPKFLVTAAVCSSKTRKQLYRGRVFWM